MATSDTKMTTDLELAEEIKWRAQKLREYAASTEYPSAPFCIDTAYYMEKILAALRRGPEREGFYEKLWKDFVSLQRGDAQDIIAKVEAYYSERPPSGEMVMVPMAVVEALSDLTELKKIKRLIEKGEATDEQCRYYEGRKEYSWRFAEQAIENARAMLSTEASKEAK